MLQSLGFSEYFVRAVNSPREGVASLSRNDRSVSEKVVSEFLKDGCEFLRDLFSATE